MKLTTAQRKLLLKVEASERGVTVSYDYKPARKLVELGLVKHKEDKYGGLHLEKL